ncbi:MAG: hypothetical protein WCX95_00075 [Candidatus Gracilibacteria bacterium]
MAGTNEGQKVDLAGGFKSVGKGEVFAAKDMNKVDNTESFLETAGSIEEKIPQMRKAVDLTIQKLAQNSPSQGEDRIKTVLSVLNSNLNFGLNKRIREGFIQGAANILQMLEGFTKQLHGKILPNEIADFLKRGEVKDVLKAKPRMSGNALGGINVTYFEGGENVFLPVESSDSPIRYSRFRLKKDAVSVKIEGGKLSLQTSPSFINAAIGKAVEFLMSGVRRKIARCPITGIKAQDSTGGKNGAEFFVDMFTDLYIKTCLLAKTPTSPQTQ